MKKTFLMIAAVLLAVFMICTAALADTANQNRARGDLAVIESWLTVPGSVDRSAVLAAYNDLCELLDADDLKTGTESSTVSYIGNTSSHKLHIKGRCGAQDKISYKNRKEYQTAAEAFQDDPHYEYCSLCTK